MPRSVTRESVTTYDLQGIPVTLRRKRVKNINLRVSRTNGEVLVSAPKSVPEAYILGFLQSRFGWIKERHSAAKATEKLLARTFAGGELHAFLGEAYPLHIVQQNKRSVRLYNGLIEIACSNHDDAKRRESQLEAWYRAELQSILSDLVKKWSALLGVNINECRIKKMKTKWGTCNITDRRIWINLELIKYPFECIDYVVLHEFAHLFERYHNQSFYAILTKHMPDWKTWDKLLDNQVL